MTFLTKDNSHVTAKRSPGISQNRLVAASSQTPTLTQDTPQMPSALPSSSVSHDVACWSFVSFPELAVLLVRLKALADIHQTNHWSARGDSFYGDHQMFERLYSNTSGEIDGVAERAVGLGGPENVTPALVAHQVAQVVSETCNQGSLPSADSLARVSLQAENEFLAKLNTLISSLESRGMLSRGLTNLLEGIADAHEVHLYLLQQRLTGSNGSF